MIRWRRFKVAIRSPGDKPWTRKTGSWSSGRFTGCTAGKLADLSQALAGRFTEHHALLCRLHRDRITGFSAAG